MKTKVFSELALHLLKKGSWGAAIETTPSGNYAAEVSAITRKAAVSGVELADLQGNFAYGAAVIALIEDLRSRSIFDALAAGGAIKVPRRARILAVSAAPAGHSRGALMTSASTNARVSPITRLDLAGGGLDTDVIMALAVFSQESLNYTDAGDFVYKLLSGAVATATDMAFLAWLAEQIGSDELAADSDSSPLHDLGQLAAEVVLTGAEKPFAIVNPREARRAATKTDANGVPVHPDMTFTGGILAGVPVLVSAAQAVGTVDLIDAGGLIYADDGLQLKPSTSGSIDMVDEFDSDDSPEKLVSLFQEDATALGVFRHLGWRLARATAAARITDCDWS